MLRITKPDEMRKVADIHWFVPAAATNVFHPPDEASTSCEPKLAYKTQTPNTPNITPATSRDTLRPARKNVTIAPNVFPLIFESFRVKRVIVFLQPRRG